MIQREAPGWTQLRNMQERLLSRFKTRLHEVLTIELDNLGKAVLSFDQHLHPMTTSLVQLFHCIHGIEPSELLNKILLDINTAYETFISRLCSRVQNSRIQSILVITNYYHIILAMESREDVVLSDIKMDYSTRLTESLALFATEELLPYFPEILHVIEGRELNHTPDHHPPPDNLVKILHDFMSTYQNKCIVIHSAIHDAFPEECRERIFEFVVQFLLKKFTKFADIADRTMLVEQVRNGLERVCNQRNWK